MTWTGRMSARVEQAKNRATGCWGRHTLKVMEDSKVCRGRIVERGHLEDVRVCRYAIICRLLRPLAGRINTLSDECCAVLGCAVIGSA